MHNGDTNPTLNIDERLRREEPPISDDDTNPSRSINVNEMLAAEESPVSVWLAANEPPLNTQDTSPSPTQTRTRSRGGAALVVLVLALSLTTIASLVWWLSGDDDPAPDTAPLIVAQQTQPPASETPGELPSVRQQQPVTVAQTHQTPVTPVAFPTAALDEIAAALQAPIGETAAGRAIVRDSSPFTIRSGDTRAEIVQYTVQDGDTLESIAEQFGLNDYYTIIWSNKSNKYSPLRTGNQLNILPEDGVYYEVQDPLTVRALADNYEIDPYTIIDADYNNLFGSSPDTLLPEGMWIVVPGGEDERALYLPAAPTTSSSSGGSAGVVSGPYTLWGCSANVQPGSAPYGRPLGDYTWMRGFIPGGHTGVDLAAPAGAPIYAAGAGTVVYANWLDGGYGNVVVVAHGSNFSLYAHMTRTTVSCGQQVSAGQQVGLVGSTGNSSGDHLHFEVRDANFNVLNPANYVGF